MPSLAGTAGRALMFALAAIPTAAFSINFCSWIFGCGCKSWWAGAAAGCNIHLVHAKHCPWCIYDGQGFVVAFVLILAAQALISFGSTRLGWPFQLALALAAFPLIGATVGVIYGFISHYWS
ncbi:MAG TPA: hypothetical protein VMT32_12675 [Bryobacteraceae bacterium]|nr:hypothetical protein [Bryobacteraceae bacterium]